jgi:hypothetical protein
MAQAASRRHQIIDMLTRAMHRSSVRADGGQEGFTCRFKDQEYGMRTRSCPAIPDRILDMIKAHLCESFQRELGGRTLHQKSTENAEQESVLVVRVPHLPSTARFTHQLESLSIARPRRAAWAIVSDGGGACLSFPGHDAISIPDDQPGNAQRVTAEAERLIRNPWASDVALALLDILLMQRAQPRSTWAAWTPPAAELDVEALATYLGVGRSTLYGVIEQFEKGGLMRPVRGRLPRLTDIPGVVSWLIDHRKHFRDKRESVVPLYAPAWKNTAEVLQWLTAKVGASTATWAITGWRACALHGLSVLVDDTAKPVEIIVREPVAAVLRDWQLKLQPYSGGSFFLMSTTSTPITAFACPGLPIAALPVVDPWQAALDVAGDPQRGIEQATAIADSLWLGQP